MKKLIISEDVPKKIGIATLHKNTNYGAVLQTYASYKFLSDCGFKCQVLNDWSASTKLFFWLKKSWDLDEKKGLIRKTKLAVALCLSIPWKAKRLKAFDRFRKKCYETTPLYRERKELIKLGLDAIVCGSDQVWNPLITEGINPVFFGDIPGVDLKISYAASVGAYKFSEEDEAEIIPLISSMDHVSVREEATAKYVSSLVGREVSTVCDPVFLLGRSDFDEVSAKRLIKRDYVLLYSIIQDEKMTEAAVKYANKRGLELVEICQSKSKDAKHRQIRSYGPSEFLSAFKHATAVFTNSFHGTAFSLIFEKDFYIFDNKHGGSRITNLLKNAGVEDRLIDSASELDLPKVDYGVVWGKMEKYVSDSRAFLERALSSRKVKLTDSGCTGCGACSLVCSCDAIRLSENKEGFKVSLIDETKCVGCGACREVCPAKNALDKHPLASDVYAFKADDSLRKDSTSGGAFAAMARAIIKKGGVFYGAAQANDLSVRHIRGEVEEDISRIQGTKYLPSNVSECYTQVEADLKEKRIVMFSGTPCQIDGIRRYLEAKKAPTEKLYTVDIICHGVPSPVLFRDYIDWLKNEYGSEIKEYKFRCKDISWRGNSSYAKLIDGREIKNDKKLSSFMNLYYSENITRESCYECKYASAERISDITISDYWGLEDLDKSFEDSLGVSMVMINTEKGGKLFDEAEGERIDGDISVSRQPQLKHPTARPASREDFWREYESKGFDTVLKRYGGMKKHTIKSVLWRVKNKVICLIKGKES